IYNSYDCEIMLYTLERSEIYAYGPLYFRFHLSPDRAGELLDRAKELYGKPLWKMVDETWEQHDATQVRFDRNSLLLTRAIKSIKTGSIIGYLMIRIDEKEFSELIRDINLDDDARAFLLDQDNVVITSDGSFTAAEAFPDGELLTRLKEREGEPFFYSGPEQRHLAAYSQVSQTGWYTVVLIPMSYLNAEPLELLQATMLAVFICAVVAYGLFRLLSLSILRPVGALRQGVEAFSRKPDAPPVPAEGRDELTDLTRRFNGMTNEITTLIQNVSRQEREKHELETMALQAQINPHFLANMLDTVVYMAQIKKEKNIEEVLLAIVNILNNCKQNATPMATVQESLDFLRSYELVQSYRMLGKFTLIYEVEEGILNCLIPRFILQPIVENALIHGIAPSSKIGHITLKGIREGKMLHFSVTDDGVGLSEEQIASVLVKEADTGRHMTGIGLPNVQRRLRLMYGEDCGIRISSVENEYTTVDIILPAQDRAEKGCSAGETFQPVQETKEGKEA
ncbi:MAG: sensor histidine kinase, partial [Clostridia bacterium]|nr:sensor histidine kinase [Clostridia bacterium]